MSRKMVNTVGRAITVYLLFQFAIVIVFGALAEEDLVLFVIREHMNQFVLVTASVSWLLTWLVLEHIERDADDDR